MQSGSRSASSAASSYWQQTAHQPRLAEDLPSHADIVVIGGGLLGCCTCYWLARAGYAPVLLERTELAFGATGRNGGFLGVGTAESYPAAIQRVGQEDAYTTLEVTLENLRLVQQVIVGEGIECDFRKPGHLDLALQEAQMAAYLHTAAILEADGCPATVLDRGQVQALIRTPLGPEIVGGLYTQESGLLHSARFIEGLYRAALRYHARGYLSSVQHITSSADGLLLQTSQGTLHADRVLIAINAWSDELVPALKNRIMPVRGQVLSYAPLPPIFTTATSTNVTATGEYWQQTRDGSIVLGGCRELAPNQEIGERELTINTTVQAALATVFPRLFPTLGNLHITRRWAGPMAFTRDYLPIADRVPDLPGAWVVGGFCGHGMPFGMRLGQLLAEALTSEQKPPALHPFRLNRPTL